MKNKNKAFTLIELLVTIVIIGILATISISTFNNYRRDAINARRQAELEQAHKKILALCITKELNMCNEINMDNLVYDSSFTDPSFWDTTATNYGPNHWVIEDGVAKNINNSQNVLDFLKPKDENGAILSLPAGNYWMAIRTIKHPSFNSFGVVISHIAKNFQTLISDGRVIELGGGTYLLDVRQNSDFNFAIFNGVGGDLIVDDIFFYKR